MKLRVRYVHNTHNTNLVYIYLWEIVPITDWRSIYRDEVLVRVTNERTHVLNIWRNKVGHLLLPITFEANITAVPFTILIDVVLVVNGNEPLYVPVYTMLARPVTVEILNALILVFYNTLWQINIVNKVLINKRVQRIIKFIY